MLCFDPAQRIGFDELYEISFLKDDSLENPLLQVLTR